MSDHELLLDCWWAGTRILVLGSSPGHRGLWLLLPTGSPPVLNLPDLECIHRKFVIEFHKSQSQCTFCQVSVQYLFLKKINK